MKNNQGMQKYTLGVLVLVALAIGILLYTFTLASGAKEDAKTSAAINGLATKLDSYVYENGVAPDNLAAAKIKDVPSSITYTKINDLHYKICVNYNSAGNALSAGFSGAASSLYGLDTATSSTPSSEASSYDTSVTYNHKKGQNCQTVSAQSIYPVGETGDGSAGFSCTDYCSDDSSSGTTDIKTLTN